MKSPLLLLAVALPMLGCGSTNSSGTSNAPADHTARLGGTSHKPGYTDPATSCASCHGANLEGATGPSCTTCHGKKW